MMKRVLLLAKPNFKPVLRLTLLILVLALSGLTLLLPPAIPVLAGFIPATVLVRLTLGRTLAYSLVSGTTLLAALKTVSLWLILAEYNFELKVTGTISLDLLILINWLTLWLVNRLATEVTQAQSLLWQQEKQLKLSLLDLEEKHVLGQTAGQDVFAITTELKRAVARQFKLHQQQIFASHQITTALTELTHTASNIATSAKDIYQSTESSLTFTGQPDCPSP